MKIKPINKYINSFLAKYFKSKWFDSLLFEKYKKRFFFNKFETYIKIYNIVLLCNIIKNKLYCKFQFY